MDKLIVGCGYLGQRVAALWLAQGQRVFGTTRSEHRAEELRQQGIEPVRCDIFDPASLTTLPKADTGLYCVGLDRSAGQSMRSVYLDGLSHVLAHLPRPERFLYVSSTGVYGQCAGENVDEMSATAPLEESGQVVLEAERLLRSQLPDAVILRFAGIYGPGRVIRRQAVEKGEPFNGDADKWLNLIHVEDGAAAVVGADMRAKPNDVYNVADGLPVRRRDFYTHMAQLLGAPAPRFIMPEPGAPLPAHERANRRIVNRRLCDELEVQLRYPSYRDGLQAALAQA